MSALLSYFSENLLVFLITAPVVLISLTLHELAHAVTADRLGDPTARQMGRLSLNPLRHLDPLGALCMLFFHVGWAKPVPIDCRYFKNPKRGMALVALMGPLVNFVLAFLFAFFYILAVKLAELFSALLISTALAVAFDILLTFLFYFHYLNLYLAIFNLIPLPPFDGSRILLLFLKDRQYFAVMRYERYIQLVLLILFYLGFANGILSLMTEPISKAFLSLFSFLLL